MQFRVVVRASPVASTMGACASTAVDAQRQTHTQTHPTADTADDPSVERNTSIHTGTETATTSAHRRGLGTRAISPSASYASAAALSRPSSRVVTKGPYGFGQQRYSPVRDVAGNTTQAWTAQRPSSPPHTPAKTAPTHSPLSSRHQRTHSPSSIISVQGSKAFTATFLPQDSKLTAQSQQQTLQPLQTEGKPRTTEFTHARPPVVVGPPPAESPPYHREHRRAHSSPSVNQSVTVSSFPRLSEKELVVDASVSTGEREHVQQLQQMQQIDDLAHFSPPHTPVRVDSPPSAGFSRVVLGTAGSNLNEEGTLPSVRSRLDRSPVDMLAIIQESPALAAQSSPQQPHPPFVHVESLDHLSEEPPQLSSSPADHARMPVTPALAAWMRNSGSAADLPVLPSPRPVLQQQHSCLGDSLSSLTPTGCSSSSSCASSQRRYSANACSFQPSDRSILLCVTEPDDTFVQALQTAGYCVVLCVGAAEAVELLTPDASSSSLALTPADFHLVICDANASLPQGSHLVDWLQQHTPELPIFLATHDDRSIPSTERWLRRGVQDVIRKNLPALCINELFTFFTTRLQQQQLPTLQEKGDSFKLQVAQQANARNLARRRSSVPSGSGGAPMSMPILLNVLVVSPDACALSETLLSWLGQQFLINFVSCSSTKCALVHLREGRSETGSTGTPRAVAAPAATEMLRSGRSASLLGSSGADLLLLDDTLDGVDAEFAAAVTSRSGLVPLMLLSDSEHSTPPAVLSLLQRSLVGVIDLPLSPSLVASKLSLFLRAIEQHRRRFLLTQRAHAYRQLLQQMRSNQVAHGGSLSGRLVPSAVPSALAPTPDMRLARWSFNQADFLSFAHSLSAFSAPAAGGPQTPTPLLLPSASLPPASPASGGDLPSFMLPTAAAIEE